MRIDLHTHSLASDGTDSPAGVVEAAVAAGLDVVALTDHDTTAGWPEALDAAARTGMTLVPGIEVSCVWHDPDTGRGISLHLLGYLHDPQHPGLVGELEAARVSRVTRAERIVAKLHPVTGLTYDEVLAQVNPGATVGRPHIADAMVARRVVPDREAAFREYLYTGSPYYATYHAVDPIHGVQLIRAAGGIAVMAHPFASSRGRLVPDHVIASMADAGMAGLEAYHLDHSPSEVAHAERLAEDLGIVVTGASDYHGDGKVNRLGDRTTAPGVFDQLIEASTATPVQWGERGRG